MKAPATAAFAAVLIGTSAFGAEPVTYWNLDAAGCKFASSIPVAANPAFQFSGTCVDGYVEGRGEVSMLDGSGTICRGVFERGRLVKGVLDMEFGFYEGELRDNTAHGRGTFTFRDGSTFKGRFDNGHPAGSTGELTWPDLGRYSGAMDLQRLLPLGKGIMYYNEGTILVGEFMEGEKAVGTMKRADGTVAQGTFEGERFVGGKVAAADGRNFEVDARTGEVLEVLKDGSKQRIDALPENIGL